MTTILRRAALAFCVTLAAPAIGSAVAATPATKAAQQTAAEAPPPIGNGREVAVVVNDQVITSYDVIQRLHFIMITSGIPNTADNQQKLLPRVIDQLIEESLKLQAAEKLKIVVSPDDVDGARKSVEDNNKMPPGTINKILTQARVDPATFDRQLRAQLGWVRAVQATLRSKVNVQPREIDTVLDTLHANMGKPQRHVGEVVMVDPTPDRDEEVHQLALHLVDQVRKGAHFDAIARQFSSSSNAAAGGDVGWVLPGQLDPGEEAALNGLQPGQVSDPYKTAAGWTFVTLFAVRTGATPVDQMPISISRLLIPKTFASYRRSPLTEAIKGARSCDDMAAIGDSFRLPGNAGSTLASIDDMPPAVQAVVKTLPLNTPSPLINVDGNDAVVMVCDRPSPDGLPSRTQIRTKLLDEKLQHEADRWLRDLRREAVVDVRL